MLRPILGVMQDQIDTFKCLEWLTSRGNPSRFAA
jgi:hypothetical protein